MAVLNLGYNAIKKKFANLRENKNTKTVLRDYEKCEKRSQNALQLTFFVT